MTKSDTNIGELTQGLSQSPKGIWYAQTAQDVSFPESQTREKFRVQDTSFWYKHRNTCIIEALRNHRPSGLLVDVGGGNGYVAQGLQAAGFETAVLEPSREGIQNARSSNITHLICATWKTAQFERNALPAVGLFDVLEHIEDDTKMLGEIFSAIIPGGRIYLTVPAHPSLWSAVDNYSGHFRRYTRHTLQRKLQQAGFQVDYSTYFFQFLTIPIFLRRTIPTHLRLLRPEKITDTTQDDQASPVFDTLFERLGLREQKIIGSRRQLHFGSSCLCVAQKPSHR